MSFAFSDYFKISNCFLYRKPCCSQQGSVEKANTAKTVNILQITHTHTYIHIYTHTGCGKYSDTLKFSLCFIATMG